MKNFFTVEEKRDSRGWIAIAEKTFSFKILKVSRKMLHEGTGRIKAPCVKNAPAANVRRGLVLWEKGKRLLKRIFCQIVKSAINLYSLSSSFFVSLLLLLNCVPLILFFMFQLRKFVFKKRETKIPGVSKHRSIPEFGTTYSPTESLYVCMEQTHSDT